MNNIIIVFFMPRIYLDLNDSVKWNYVKIYIILILFNFWVLVWEQINKAFRIQSFCNKSKSIKQATHKTPSINSTVTWKTQEES